MIRANQFDWWDLLRRSVWEKMNPFIEHDAVLEELHSVLGNSPLNRLPVEESNGLSSKIIPAVTWLYCCHHQTEAGIVIIDTEITISATYFEDIVNAWKGFYLAGNRPSLHDHRDTKVAESMGVRKKKLHSVEVKARMLEDLKDDLLRFGPRVLGGPESAPNITFSVTTFPATYTQGKKQVLLESEVPYQKLGELYDESGSASRYKVSEGKTGLPALQTVSAELGIRYGDDLSQRINEIEAYFESCIDAQFGDIRKKTIELRQLLEILHLSTAVPIDPQNLIYKK